MGEDTLLYQTSINDGKVLNQLNDHCVYFMAVLDILLHSIKNNQVKGPLKAAIKNKNVLVRREVS